MSEPAPDTTALCVRWTAMLGTECARAEHRVLAQGVRDYADLFGYDASCFRDTQAAVAEGFRGIVAPAAYAAVYTMQAVLEALHAPHLGVPFAWNLHAGQSLELGEPACAGDVLTTTVTLRDVTAKGANLFYAFGTRTTNDSGELCATGTSTHVVRVA